MMGRLLTVLLHDGTEHDIDLDAPETTSMAELARRFAVRWGEPPAAAADDPADGDDPGQAGGQVVRLGMATVTLNALPPAPRNGGSDRVLPQGAEPGAAAVAEPGDEAGAEPLTPLFTARGPLPASMTLGDSPLRDGVRVGFGVVPPDDEPAAGDYELRIVAGPGAGTIHTFTRKEMRKTGELLAGRAETAGWDMLMFAGATRPSLSTDRKKFAVIDGEPVKMSSWAREWPDGTMLTMGNLCLEFCEVPKAGTSTTGMGVAGTTVFDLSHEHTPRPASRPFVDRVPVRWYNRPSTRRRMAAESARRAERLPLVQAAAQSRQALPDAAEVLSLVTRRSNRVWERDPRSRAFLTLRCGLDIEVPPRDWDGTNRLVTAHGGVATAPVGDVTPVAELPLRELGAIGLVGSGGLPRRIAAWFAAQVAALHRPHDVVVRVLTDKESAGEWRWLRWLPRSATPLDVDEPPRVLAQLDRRGGRAALKAFEEMVEERDGTWHGPGRGAPEVLLIVECPRSGPTDAMTRLVRKGPQVGVHVVWVAEDPEHLPPECRTVVLADDTGMGQVRTPDGRSWPVLLDLVPWPYFERLARSLAPLRDKDAEDRRRALRQSALTEILDLDAVSADRIAEQWRAVPHTTSVPVGLGTRGPYSIDLRRDGPHALVSGALGSGKSEFLLTWVASLAVANRPDELTVVLMDHKGGGPEISRLAELPHVTALLTDFDARQSARIIIRLGLLLRSRGRALASAEVKDLEAYQDRRRRNPRLPPMPRLVFVVDEFAALSREAPDLVNGLLDTARRGRSLGIHLVLATQQAGRVATGDVLVNTNLRIGLRAAQEQESLQILGSADAAHIGRSTPGRAFVRAGSGRLDEVQLAQVSAAGGLGAPRIEVREMGPSGELPPHRGRLEGLDFGSPLDALVTAVQDATAALGIEVPAGPLPPPLAETVTLAEVRPPDAWGSDVPPVAYGIQDVPDEPARQCAVFDLARTGSLSVAGTRGSGRSQFLRTFAAAVARQNSTADVHLYGIDCGDGGLLALAGLPHCGVVVTPRRPDLISRLLGRLTATVFLRKEILATGGFRDVAAQRQAMPADQRLPYLVVLLDRWEAFAALDADHTDFAAELTGLLREGPGVGVRVVVTGERALLTRPMTSRFQEQLALGLASEDDYLLAGINPRLVPASITPGRAFHADSFTETQVALLDGDPTRRGQADALGTLATRLRERDAGVPESRRPFRIEDAPRAADQFRVGAGKGRPVGREDVLAWLRDRCGTGASTALLGPRRAGKTWVLEELQRRLQADGFRAVHKLVVPEPNSSVESPDALASILLRDLRGTAHPAEALLDKASSGTGADRLVFLLDEVGRLASYGPAAVSWLRDLGQAGAWLMYTGTEKDWLSVVRWALTLPGSSFGNDIGRRALGPLDRDAALDFLTGTAANLGVNLGRDTAATRIVDLVGTWPFYLQAVGDGVVRAVQANDLQPLNSPAALQALVDRRLLDDWAHHFQSRWAEIGAAGRAALLARPGEQPRDASPTQRQDLREVGLLLPGERWSDDPPFLAWIARNEISLRDEELPA
ncbi:DNA segregation ATPase FtsK/SpoIIIE, S-DNA-T family [Actinacidiphila rubida]|uniref:DNA segregation ATPase FtsK/SpoIIIE, S-DNA-T family n=3 Tax=Actinacidiphila rubida TaxID=310780 RepID=A0A1H8KU86_9ACTN|nr:FtsK/SpoIIIE domain-containing protein [Actinacidiphila rubida]SEN96447.1 DNA segregation ATPase FtsK/SpoIIIE, S-DNA-T family [Actinacidiphila rubida]